jgi:hypothetical protein
MSSTTLWNVILIVAASGVAVGGIFGEGYDKAALAATRWWKFWKYVTPRGWIMLSLTGLVVVASVWKYQHDFADVQAKEGQIATDRDAWKSRAAERDASTQGKLDGLTAKNATLRDELKKQGEEFARQLASLRTQNDSLAGQAAVLRRQLVELKKDSEGMVLATAMAGSTTSASVIKARDDLIEEVKTSTDVLGQSVTKSDDALFHLLTDMHQKDVVPMHNAIDWRGRGDDDLPTLKNVRDECASTAEIEAVLKGPVGKTLCPACTCTLPTPATGPADASP